MALTSMLDMLERFPLRAKPAAFSHA
jgi:hypothetical protein